MTARHGVVVGRWLACIFGYLFTVVHLNGVDNNVMLAVRALLFDCIRGT